jgi:DNA-binding transcriptional MerR regulator
MSRKLFGFCEFARRTGLSERTLRQYNAKAFGLLPPPSERQGHTLLWSPGDVALFKSIYRGRPKLRKSYRRKRRRK